MRIFRLLTLLLASSIAINGAFAQPNRGVRVKKSPDLLALENEMLQTRYSANPTEENKAAYLKSSEGLLPIQCKAMKEKPEYIQEGCQNLLTKIKDVDANNPKVFCYENGFENPDCKATSADPSLPKLSPYDQLKLLLDKPPPRPRYTQQDMQDPERMKVRQLTDELVKAQLSYRQTQNPADKERCLRIYNSLLPTVCKYLPGQPYTPSLECKNHIEQALSIEPRFPTALCYKEGPGSQFCKRGNSARNQGQAPQGQSTDKGGFTEF
jgi:hypothetical protein